jgi:hypothetical protein
MMQQTNYCRHRLLSILASAVYIVTVVKLQHYADPQNNRAAKESAHKLISTKGCKSVVLSFGIGVNPIPKSKY